MPPVGTHALRPFHAIAVNVNGLAEPGKRRRFFAWLQQQRCDVGLLVETHCRSTQIAQQWIQEGAGPGRPWQGHAFFAHRTCRPTDRATAGVAVLLSPQIVAADTEPTVAFCDSSDGRLLRVEWTAPWGQHMAAVAVYAPAEAAQRPNFFDTGYTAALDAGSVGASLIVGGDFNCAMTVADVQAAAGRDPDSSSRRIGAQELRLINDGMGLVDAWRAQHPHRCQPTHYSFGQAAVAPGPNSGSVSGGAPTSSASRHPAPSTQATSAGRIDYIFLSPDLVQGGWQYKSSHGLRTPADHRPVCVTLQPPAVPVPGSRRWRFPNHLLSNDAFMAAMEQSLQQALGQQQQVLPRRDPLTEWEQLVQHIQATTPAIQRQVQQPQRAEQVRLRQAVATARRQQDWQPGAATTTNLLAAEQALQDWEQQQRQQQVEAAEPLWDVYGERSTFYFHRLGKRQLPPQVISGVAAPGGAVVATDTPQGAAVAAGLLADFYDPATGGLFAQHPTDPQQQQVLLQSIDKRLSAEEQEECLGQAGDGFITVDEAAAALASLPRGKAPGSDGLTYEFYSAFWELLGEPMVAAFNHAFAQQQQQQQQLQQQLQQPHLSPRQRLGLVTLIYKEGGKPRENPDSYRPITLLQCDVKIIAKVMVQRFSPGLCSIIDSTQTAFVPGRTAADNVLLHLEECDYLAGEQLPGCIVFLDFFKAYDRLDRTWVLRCMEAMAFPPAAIRWVCLLLAGTQGSIIFNGGHRSRTFDIPSGCAQGSPLSPLLYVIAAQPLAARCRALQTAGQFTSIMFPDGTAAPPIHQHADDTSLHAASRQDVQLLVQQAVQPFCAASGALLSPSKCEGLTLGSHAAFVGVDDATGIPFPDTSQQPIRHLGLLLSREGAMPHAQLLFTQRLQSITWRVRQWAQHDLTLHGRCEVARQVLASCFTYHCQFLPVPAPLMSGIHKRITSFVLSKGCLRQEQLRRLVCSPPAAVAALPERMGGIRQVDIRAHASAMQAKVAAMALHPRRAAWKLFFTANLERALPGLGMAALVQQTHYPTSHARAQGRLSPRHAAYIDAFRQVGLQRQVPHSDMTAEQIRLELLVGNHSVGAPADGCMLPSVGSLPSGLGSAAGTTIGQAEQQLLQQQGATSLVLPAEWRHTLQLQPPAAPAWHADPQQEWVRLTSGARVITFRVLQDGSLQPHPDLPAAVASGPWFPCCVVDANAPHLPGSLVTLAARDARRQLGGRRTRAGDDDPDLALFLVGLYATIKVDPGVWGFGTGVGVLQFSVRYATRRLLVVQCARQHYPGWEPGVGMRPRLWRDLQGAEAPGVGLSQLETGQKRSYEQMMAAGAVMVGTNSRAADSSSGSGSSAFNTPAQMAAYHASWMDASPPRQLPRMRVAAAAAVLTLQRQQQLQQQAQAPAVNDALDPLLGHASAESRPRFEWTAAYKRAAHKRLPHRLREFGWRMLHGNIKVGARRLYTAPAGTPLRALACQHQQCQQQQPPPLATLSHVFLDCPVAVAVLQWFLRVWRQVQPAAPATIISSRVLLLDDSTIWAPPRQHAQLWTLLRLLLLESIYVVACQHPWQRIMQQLEQQRQHQQLQPPPPLEQEQPPATGGAPGVTALAVASRFKAELKNQMMREWLRVDRDIREGSGMPRSWLRGRSPEVPRSAFTARWSGLVALPPSGPPLLVVPMSGLS